MLDLKFSLRLMNIGLVHFMKLYMSHRGVMLYIVHFHLFSFLFSIFILYTGE